MEKTTKVQAIKATIEKYERLLAALPALPNCMAYRDAEERIANEIAMRLGYGNIGDVMHTCFLCEYGSQLEETGEVEYMCDACPIKAKEGVAALPCMKSSIILQYRGIQSTNEVANPYGRLFSYVYGGRRASYRRNIVGDYIKELLAILNHYLHYETEGAEGVEVGLI